MHVDSKGPSLAIEYCAPNEREPEETSRSGFFASRCSAPNVAALESRCFAAVRRTFEATSYQDALAMCKSLGVAGISKQSFGLSPKILEVDEIARSDERVFEVHPEVSFRGMAGQPLKYSKKSWNGVSLRRLLLAQHDIILPEDLGEAGLAPVDDVLDAAAAAWTANRIARGKAVSLPSPPEQVEGGRPAAIWY